MHLVIDGYGGDPNRLWDQALVRDFLESFPAQLGMTRMSEPQVSSWEDPDPGISGFVVIAESHICIHSFPQRDYVNIDIFSCRSFDHQQALQSVVSIFRLERVKTWLLERGLEFLEGEQGAEPVPARSALAGLPGTPGD